MDFSWTFANPLPVTPKMCKVGTHSAQGSWVWATWSPQRNIEGGQYSHQLGVTSNTMSLRNVVTLPLLVAVADSKRKSPAGSRAWFDCVDRHVYLLICVRRSNVFNGRVQLSFQLCHRSTDTAIQSRRYKHDISTDIIFLQISTYYQDPYVGEGMSL